MTQILKEVVKLPKDQFIGKVKYFISEKSAKLSEPAKTTFDVAVKDFLAAIEKLLQ
jgi:hypothetical protein